MPSSLPATRPAWPGMKRSWPAWRRRSRRSKTCCTATTAGTPDGRPTGPRSTRMSEANGRLVRASSEQHKAFAESLIWQDYTDVITLWLEEVRTNLETERDPADVRRLQGVVSAC